MSTSSKSKTPASTNNVEAYNKETLGDEIHRLTITNAQLMADKTETEKVKVNLEIDRVQLFGEKNSLIAKKEKFRTEIAVLNVAGPLNIPIRRHQNPLLKLIRNKLKTKRLTHLYNIKKNL